MSDETARIEAIIKRYQGQRMTETLRSQIAKDVMPFLGEVSDHIEKKTAFDVKENKIHLVMRAKTPLGKLLLDMISHGAEESQ